LHPDLGETSRERPERLRQPVQLSQVMQPDDGLFGALPTYVAGQL